MVKDVEVLEATAAFFQADERYLTLVRTFLHSEADDGQAATARALAQINAARKIRDKLEARMYQVWSRHGYGRGDGHKHLLAPHDRASTPPTR